MDTERSGEVSDVSETPQQEEAVMEKEVVSKLTTPEEFTEPENPPAADEDHEQPAVNGHSTEETKSRETDELIVTESETVSEEKAEMEVEEPDVVTKPDESSENNSDPVGALDVEPEKIQPVPENIPEPLPVQTPLADAASVPAPDELPKSVPEAEPPAQMLHEPVEPPQLVDKQPLDREEEVSEKVEAEAESKPTMDTGAEEEAARESGDAAKEDAAKADGSSEKTTEAVALKEEEVVESGNVKIAEEEKEAEKAAASDTAAAAEPVAESEPEKETVPETGSLSFALLEQEQTRDALRTSRTLVVLRGLPGSGKSFLARAIADAYKDQCTIISADDYGIKPESPESCADGYKALDEAVVACCAASSAASSALIVVDDTNHTQDRLARMGEVANEHHLVVVFLEPRTEWSRDVAQLSKKTRRGLEEAQMKAMHGQLEEMSLPLFFGWFLLSSVQEKVRCTAMDFLKTLDTLEAFKKHSAEFTGKADKDVDLEQYFEAIGALHCTTKFCNYGKAEGAKEYVQKQAVKDFYGSTFELSLSALFVTPRTVGARVSLTTEQLLLWPADAEKEAEAVVPAAASLPPGSRAHVTLGCAQGVEPVQTGLDLLGILALQQGGQQGELVEEMELGTLTYYGEGRWLLGLREPICVPACFSSFYGGKEPETTKKEPEKKKKPKCTIL